MVTLATLVAKLSGVAAAALVKVAPLIMMSWLAAFAVAFIAFMIVVASVVEVVPSKSNLEFKLVSFAVKILTLSAAVNVVVVNAVPGLENKALALAPAVS
jgi:heme/copper-type cytochrome/quinol oxidase subunit 3